MDSRGSARLPHNAIESAFEWDEGNAPKVRARHRVEPGEGAQPFFVEPLLIVVTRSIVDEIQIALSPQAKARLASTQPVNAEAYEYYLKGRFHWFQLNPTDLELSMQYFQRALQRDPDYALAHTGIGQVWGGRVAAGLDASRDAFPKAKTAALKALAIDDTLAEAHDLLAWVLTWHDYDWPNAEKAFRRAIQLNPNYAHAHCFFGLFLNSMKRWDEARIETTRALELDPHNFFFQWIYGFELLCQRRYAEAIEQIRKSPPGFPTAHYGLWSAYNAQEMHREALTEAEAALPLRAPGAPSAVDALRRADAAGGYHAAMRAVADELVRCTQWTFVNALVIAEFYAAAGEKDLACDWFERAYEERGIEMVYLNLFPTWDPLRGEKKFQEILRRMNFPA